MALFEGKTPAERKRMIIAAVLGVVAIFSLWYAFLGSTGGKPQPARNSNRLSNSNSTPPITPRPVDRADGGSTPEAADEIDFPKPVQVNWTVPDVPAPDRNIFAFYVPPPRPTPTPTPVPTPIPTPVPPLLLSAISPVNVYARTSDFTIEVSGDKFTPSSRVVVDNRELQTRYINAQRLTATVPAALIAYEGGRQVSVRTPDGKLYSNAATLNVMAPPAPNFTYVGIVGGPTYNDTAILKDNNTKNLVNVQRGDTLGGRFRVTSISEREVVVVDTNLRITHKLPYTQDGSTSPGMRTQQQQQRVPTRPVDEEGEEP